MKFASFFKLLTIMIYVYKRKVVIIDNKLIITNFSKFGKYEKNY
jgi:hypothetical protein